MEGTRGATGPQGTAPGVEWTQQEMGPTGETLPWGEDAVGRPHGLLWAPSAHSRGRPGHPARPPRSLPASPARTSSTAQAPVQGPSISAWSSAPWKSKAGRWHLSPKSRAEPSAAPASPGCPTRDTSACPRVTAPAPPRNLVEEPMLLPTPDRLGKGLPSEPRGLSKRQTRVPVLVPARLCSSSQAQAQITGCTWGTLLPRCRPRRSSPALPS